jgi:hypothetical protein
VLIARFVAVFIRDMMVTHGTINGVAEGGRHHGIGLNVEELI